MTGDYLQPLHCFRRLLVISASSSDLPSSVVPVAALLDHLPIALVVTDVAANIVYLNAHYRQMLRIPEEMAVVGQSARTTLTYLLATFANAAAVSSAITEAVEARRDLIGLVVELHDGRYMSRDAVRLPDGSWLVTYRDVTAETYARREIETLARIPAQNPNPVYRLTAAGEVEFANPAALVLRASLGDQELSTVRRLMSELVRNALMSGAEQQTTLVVGTRTYDAYLTPFPQEQYANLYLVEATARHAAEAETRRQRTFYESILNHLPADVFVLSPELRYQYLNPQAIRDADLRAWLIGHDDLEYFARRRRPRKVAEERQRLLRQALADGQQVSWEEIVPHPDGRSTQYLTRFAQPVYDDDGHPLMLIGYGLDITPIREAQLAAAHSEKQYRDLMQYSQALICTHDLSGQILSVNPAMAEMLHRPAQDLIGRSMGELLPVADREGLAGYLAQFADRPGATGKGVLRVQPWSQEAPRYVLYHNVRVEEQGQPPYVIGYAQDITERVQAEHATQQAREAAEAAARARENFLASMSHEIRTPLNGVLGMGALLEKTPLTAEQQQYVGLIRTAGRSLLALLNDVLDLSKISSGKLELVAEPFDLDALIGDIAQPLALRAAQKGIGFTVDSLPVAPLGVRSDAQRLTQILTNLLANAVKFTERGGVTLRAQLRSVLADTVRVTFLVIDSGIGITPEHQEKIFEEFTQAYTDTSRRFGGTGLGLAISERLVGQLGGRLVLSSEPGVGTTFGFTLTLLRAADVVRPPALLPDPVGIVGLRVLLAEDHPVNRLLARLMLVHHGATVAEATNGREAVALATAQVFDVVLMDIQMPEMSGLEATTQIRALPDPARAGVPILALTANAFRSDTERYLAAGMDGCLTKPFEEADLLAALAELVPGRLPPRPAPAAPADPVPLPEPEFPATALRLAQGSMAFVREMVAEFVQTTPPLLAQLGAATRAQAATVSGIAHQLAPNARVFDAPEAATVLKLLETTPVTDPQWDEVRLYAVQELTDLLAALRRWQVEQPADGPLT